MLIKFAEIDEEYLHFEITNEIMHGKTTVTTVTFAKMHVQDIRDVLEEIKKPRKWDRQKHE